VSAILIAGVPGREEEGEGGGKGKPAMATGDGIREGIH
jgi:hypothetical protein